MFTILYSRPKKFPAGPVRTLLTQHVPLYSWLCGEEDNGADDCAYEYGRPILVSGRGNSEAVFVEIDVDHAPTEDRPPAPGETRFAVRVKRPTTESDTLAERIAAVTALAMASIDEEGAQLRFDGTDAWLGLDRVVRLGELVLGGETIADIVADLAAAAPAVPVAAPLSVKGETSTAAKIAHAPDTAPLPRERRALRTPEPADPATPPRPVFGRRTGGFGKRGL